MVTLDNLVTHKLPLVYTATVQTMSDLEYYSNSGKQQLRDTITDFFSNLPTWENTVQNANLLDTLLTKVDRVADELISDIIRETKKAK